LGALDAPYLVISHRARTPTSIAARAFRWAIGDVGSLNFRTLVKDLFTELSDPTSVGQAELPASSLPISKVADPSRIRACPPLRFENR
jgi:hypothetical protein